MDSYVASMDSYDQWKKTPGCLGYIGDEILPSYVGIIEKNHKDPYQTSSNKGFFRGSY